MADVADLTTLEMEVLLELSRGRTTPSVVRLAAELWQPGSPWAHGDPVGLVTFTLRGLNDRGLVTYRLNDSTTEGGPGHFHGLPHTIRLTSEGWLVCGHGVRHQEAGTIMSQRMQQHDPDPTEYRNYHDRTTGGVIVKEDAFDHITNYPWHDHSFLFEGDDDMVDSDSRNYTRITADIQAEILMAKTRLGTTATYGEIAEATGYTSRQVRYVLTQLPSLRRLNGGDEKMSNSLRARIIQVLSSVGAMKDAVELRRVLGADDDTHSIVHLLGSLKQQGIVAYREEKRGTVQEPVDIRLTKNTKRHLATAKAEAEEGATPEGEPGGGTPLDEVTVEALVNPKPEIVTDLFPLLRDLKDRERRRIKGDETSLAYMAAAEAVKAVDPDTYDLLMAKANENAVPFPSPLEREYLTYAESHSRHDEFDA
jgi:hypothetical protein